MSSENPEKQDPTTEAPSSVPLKHNDQRPSIIGTNHDKQNGHNHSKLNVVLLQESSHNKSNNKGPYDYLSTSNVNIPDVNNTNNITASTPASMTHETGSNSVPTTMPYLPTLTYGQMLLPPNLLYSHLNPASPYLVPSPTLPTQGFYPYQPPNRMIQPAQSCISPRNHNNQNQHQMMSTSGGFIFPQAGSTPQQPVQSDLTSTSSNDFPTDKKMLIIGTPYEMKDNENPSPRLKNQKRQVPSVAHLPAVFYYPDERRKTYLTFQTNFPSEIESLMVFIVGQNKAAPDFLKSPKAGVFTVAFLATHPDTYSASVILVKKKDKQISPSRQTYVKFLLKSGGEWYHTGEAQQIFARSGKNLTQVNPERKVPLEMAKLTIELYNEYFEQPPSWKIKWEHKGPSKIESSSISLLCNQYLRVGREPLEGDISATINLPTVSRQHCDLRHEEKTKHLFLKPLASTNGVTLVVPPFESASVMKGSTLYFPKGQESARTYEDWTFEDIRIQSTTLEQKDFQNYLANPGDTMHMENLITIKRGSTLQTWKNEEFPLVIPAFAGDIQLSTIPTRPNYLKVYNNTGSNMHLEILPHEEIRLNNDDQFVLSLRTTRPVTFHVTDDTAKSEASLPAPVTPTVERTPAPSSKKRKLEE